MSSRPPLLFSTELIAAVSPRPVTSQRAQIVLHSEKAELKLFQTGAPDIVATTQLRCKVILKHLCLLNALAHLHVFFERIIMYDKRLPSWAAQLVGVSRGHWVECTVVVHLHFLSISFLIFC